MLPAVRALLQHKAVFRRMKVRDTQAIRSLYLKLSVVNLLRWLNSMLSSKPLGLISPCHIVHLTYADYELFFMTF